MKKEEYFCDVCSITLTESTGVTLQCIAALGEKRILTMLENIGDDAYITRHLCTVCYNKMFAKEPIVYGRGTKIVSGDAESRQAP